MDVRAEARTLQTGDLAMGKNERFMLSHPCHVMLCHGWGTHFSCGLARLSAALPVGDFNSFEGRLNLTNH